MTEGRRRVRDRPGGEPHVGTFFSGRNRGPGHRASGGWVPQSTDPNEDSLRAGGNSLVPPLLLIAARLQVRALSPELERRKRLHFPRELFTRWGGGGLGAPPEPPHRPLRRRRFAPDRCVVTALGSSRRRCLPFAQGAGPGVERAMGNGARSADLRARPTASGQGRFEGPPAGAPISAIGKRAGVRKKPNGESGRLPRGSPSKRASEVGQS